MAIQPTNHDFIFQGFFIGLLRRRTRVGGHPDLNDDRLVALVRGLRQIESGELTSIESGADLLRERPPSPDREQAARENRQIERQVAKIILDGFPPHIAI